MKKNKLFISIISIFIFSLLIVGFSKKSFSPYLKSFFSFNQTVLADDDGDEDDDDDDDDENDRDEDDDDSDDSSSSSTPKTYQQVIKLPDQIITKTIVEDVILLDSDKDGIIDADDPHPAIPEYIIVNDANGNGIDDNFEISIEDKNGNGVADNYENVN